MKKLFIFSLLVAVSFVTLFASQAQARARYSSTRIGGYTSHGKGSYYIGGYIRSTPIHYKSFR